MNTLLKIIYAFLEMVYNIAKARGRDDLIREIAERNQSILERIQDAYYKSPESKQDILDWLKKNKLIITFFFLIGLSGCCYSTPIYDTSIIKTASWTEQEQVELYEYLLNTPQDSIVFKVVQDYVSIKNQLKAGQNDNQ